MRLNYQESGDGECVLLCGHGFPFDHTLWDAQRTALSARFRIITPDLRGFGASPVGGRLTTMADMADDLAELLDTLNLAKCVYCGLSMGGYVGWEFWNRHADRLSGLVICDTNARADTPEAAANRLATADRVEQENQTALLTAGIGKLLAPENIAANTPAVAIYRRMVETNNPQGVAAAARGMAQRTDFTARLSEIKLPALVIAGEVDALSPPAAMRTLAAAMPNARVVVIPNAGHLTPIENPAAVNTAIGEFLETLSRS